MLYRNNMLNCYKLYHSIVRFSRRQNGGICFIFPRKQALKLHAIYLPTLRDNFAWNDIAYLLDIPKWPAKQYTEHAKR